MENFIWQESFSVGIEYFDNQHKKLFKIANELQEGILKSQSKEVIKVVLHKLHDYMKTHFHDEEAFLKFYAFSDFDSHVQSHHEFESQILKFENDIFEGKLFVPMKLMNFLENWLFDHILKDDKEFGRSLGEKEIRSDMFVKTAD